MDQKLAEVTDPAYLEGISTLPIERVRAMRAECQAIENTLSYVRRLAQGRLDIVGAELERRRAGGDPRDLRDLIGRLPDILSERGTAGGLPRPPLDLSTQDLTAGMVAEVDQILSPTQVGSVADLTDDQLADVRDRLDEYERRTSAIRHTMHAVIEALQAEIARRYRSGEASVDTLLQ
ncbi:MAG TPA: hypothetical protein VF183_15405 [Acidimicrobiales bacterium]